MAVVDVAIAAGTALGVGGGGVAAGLVGGAAIGAGAGALYSGITGDGDILNSALTGALIGGGVGGLGAGLGLTGASGTLFGSYAPAAGGALSGVGSALGLAEAAPVVTPTAVAGTANTPALASSVLNSNAPFGSVGSATIDVTTPSVLTEAAPTVVQGAAPVYTPEMQAGLDNLIAEQSAKYPMDAAAKTAAGLTGKEMLGYGLAGTAALSLLGGMNQPKLSSSSTPGQNPSYIRPYTYSVSQNKAAFPTGPQYGANGLPILPTSEQNYFNQSYTAGTPYKAAAGGLMASPVPGMMQNGPANVDFMGGDMYPTSQQHRAYYATPTQMPTSAQAAMASYEPKANPLTGEMTANMADGGITYDAATQTYRGLPTMVGAPAQDISVVDRPTAQAQPEPNPFTMFGGFGPFSEIGMTPTQIAQAGMGEYTPATSLYKDEIGNLTSQWQAANPNARSYNPANQTYGAGKPTNAQLLALKNAQERQAFNDRLSAFQAQDVGTYSGGGARGGLMPYNLGSYSDGGRLLKGPGDGVSDDIPAVIGNKQPARLADGEFVIPARIVSELGNGSTDAGAKRLYAMMDRIQSGRKKTIGKDKVAVDTKSEKNLPA